MKELLNELKFFINKELYQCEKFDFSEFKLILKGRNDRYKFK